MKGEGSDEEEDDEEDDDEDVLEGESDDESSEEDEEEIAAALRELEDASDVDADAEDVVPVEKTTVNDKVRLSFVLPTPYRTDFSFLLVHSCSFPASPFPPSSGRPRARPRHLQDPRFHHLLRHSHSRQPETPWRHRPRERPRARVGFVRFPLPCLLPCRRRLISFLFVRLPFKFDLVLPSPVLSPPFLLPLPPPRRPRLSLLISFPLPPALLSSATSNPSGPLSTPK